MAHTHPKNHRTAAKRVFALTLSIGMLLTGCGSISSVTERIKINPWINSNIDGYVTADAEFRPQDDFAAAANKDWILSSNSPGILYDVLGRVLEKKRALLEDRSTRSKEIEEVRKYAALAEDWDARDRMGVEPLRKYLDEIESISSLEEYYSWICSTEKNPLNIAPLMIENVSQSQADPTMYSTNLNRPSLSLNNNPDSYFSMTSADIDAQETVVNKVTYTLERLGYESSDIKRIINENFKMEKTIAKNTSFLSKDDVRDISYSRSDLEESAGNYPLLKYLDARGFEKTERYLMDISYVRQLDGICRSAGLSKLKSLLTVQYILYAGKYLDRETTDYFNAEDEARKTDDGSGDLLIGADPDDKTLFADYIGQDPVMEAALDKEYVDKYTDPGSYDRLLKMTEKIIDTYHDIFNSESWLSDEGKAACIEKLDAMKIHIIYPDTSAVDLSDLNIITGEEGGNFLEAAFAAKNAYTERLANLSLIPYDQAFWNPYNLQTGTTSTNASYLPANNGIYIYTGILEDPIYYPGMPDEELYGGIGAIVGHEITHGFDATGALYNKDGLELQWLPAEDQMAFNDKTDAVSHYYSAITPFPGSGLYDGSRVKEEATADMGGFRVTLKIAEDIPGFDYDRYFRSVARFYTAKYPFEREFLLSKYDVHPLNFLRVNVGLQQFEEFYETYDVKPGDGMYLEEKKRITVW